LLAALGAPLRAATVEDVREALTTITADLAPTTGGAQMKRGDVLGLAAAEEDARIEMEAVAAASWFGLPSALIGKLTNAGRRYVPQIGIGGRLAAPPLPHHLAYGSRTSAVRSG
jgi:hypothetical protein